MKYFSWFGALWYHHPLQFAYGD